MEDSKFEQLVNNQQIYPQEFVLNFGMKSPHWETENWQRRERSLCHDMICVLLANLEPSETIEDTILNKLKRASTKQSNTVPRKRVRFDDPIEGTSASTSHHWDEYSSCESEGDDICSDSEDSEYDPEKEFEEMNPDINKYRYIVLEGSLNASEIQGHFCSKWGLGPLTKLFDLVDTKERLLIEVKTTTMVPEILKDYSSHKDTSDRTCLIVVDMIESSITAYNKRDEMPGLSKATSFLLQRKSYMKTLGIEDRSYNEVLLSKLVFKSTYLNNTCEFIENFLFKKIRDDMDIKEISVEGFKIENITQEKIFKNLRKPLYEKYESKCVYKGKLTPFFYCKYMELDDETDIHAVDTIFIELNEGTEFVSGDLQLYNAIIELMTKWFDSEKRSKNFGFIDMKIKKEKQELSENIKDVLRIGKKGKTFNSEIEGATQMEREPIKNLQYPEWFELLYKEMSKKADIHTFETGNIEKQSKIPLYKHLGEWLNRFYEEIGKRNVGGYMDQISNFYSRISGSYNTTIGGKTTHSNIAAIPLRFNTREEDTTKRWITGIAVRGPHHMRSATDKANLVMVERINEHALPEGFYKGGTLVKTRNAHFLIRKTAIKKIDGIHLTFIRNSVFIASNMIGDIIMRQEQFTTEDAFKAMCSAHLTNEQSMNFFIDRVIDAVLMATLGNSRDEGYLSVFRKFFMILLNSRRNQESFTFDVEGMCGKLNECLIDNPFSMFLQNSLVYMVCNM